MPPTMMARRIATALIVTMCLAMMPGLASAEDPPTFTPGASGVGDPYFPLDGNGGYQVIHYGLDVRYDPATDVLAGVTTIKSRATQDLSGFNLDFVGLTVHDITVDGASASWSRNGQELTITPASGIRNGATFITVVTYDGVPEPIEDAFGISGFLHTDDGALILGEPHVAATWFPANDHPIDKATFNFHITVPEGLEAVANGTFERQITRDGWTTWVWDSNAPMATYLAGVGIGEFEIRHYRQDGILYWDAVDPDLFTDFAAPTTGDQFAISQQADSSYKRLTRTIEVPAEGATLSFWVTRDTEPEFDYFFVEARTVGSDDDWTTLPDLNGHATQETGFVCPFWLDLHPFLEHYQTALPDEDPEDEFPPACEPSGSTGDWWAVSGSSAGPEEWQVDLSAWANSTLEISLTYASDDIAQLNGVTVDDIVVSTGEGSTSFEADDDVMDGWTVPGAPENSPGNLNDWIVGAVEDLPPTLGEQIFASFDRQPEIIAFLAESFGKYPFRVAGGIVDDLDAGFALENQTRPIYSPVFWLFGAGDDVVVHELAHQWYGDSVTVEQWQHIWLNEGFATYAEWMWLEAQGFATADEIFAGWYETPAEEEFFWGLVIGDPGPDNLFAFPVYIRGAMTLHVLRMTVGDEAFFGILERWARKQGGGHGTTAEFIATAEQVSGQQLDELFEAWLFTPTKPMLEATASALERSTPNLSTLAMMKAFEKMARGDTSRGTVPRK